MGGTTNREGQRKRGQPGTCRNGEAGVGKREGKRGWGREQSFYMLPGHPHMAAVQVVMAAGDGASYS